MQFSCIAAALIAAQESSDPIAALIPTPTSVSKKEGYVSKDAPVKADLDDTRTNLGNEGYSLICESNGYHLTAKTEKGLFYGQQTLNQLKKSEQVPCCEILDIPVMEMRAVMFDLARCKEKHEYYYHIIDQLAQWKINTVFLHFTDNSGCAIEIKHYPNIATLHAFTQDEIKDLIKYAAERHIELIPEVESWGHAFYITRLPEFADLAEDKAAPRSLCTSNPKTWEVLSNIIEEIAELFPSKYIHAGCDEASFGRCEKCVARAEEIGMDALAGEHAQKLCELVKSIGKTPMIWADILLKHRDSMMSVPKDTIIFHWEYNAKVDPEPVEFLIDKGFEVVVTSAIVQGSRMILPMADTLDNVSSCTDIILSHKCWGMDTTVWLPQRYIADTINFALAYASELSWCGPKRTRLEFAKAFANNYFGFTPDAKMIQTLWEMHSLSEICFSKMFRFGVYGEQMASLDPEDLDKQEIPLRELAKTVLSILRNNRSKITSHQAEYDALILAAETSSYLQERTADLFQIIRNIKGAEKLVNDGKTDNAVQKVNESIKLLSSIKQEDDSIREKLETAWDIWRYADDPLKKGDTENLMEAFRNSRIYIHVLLERFSNAKESISDADLANIFRKPEDSEGPIFMDSGDLE